MGKFISLRYDYSFKHLFLNEEVKRYFISDELDINTFKDYGSIVLNMF